MARPGTAVLPLVEERLIVVASRALLGGASPSPADFADFPLIQQATRPRLWADWFDAADIEPVERLRGPRITASPRMASSVTFSLSSAPDFFSLPATLSVLIPVASKLSAVSGARDNLSPAWCSATT